MNEASLEAIQHARRFRKVVIWGLRRQWHSHRFIHQGFFETFKYLGIPVVWTDFSSDPGIIEAGDFVITSNVYGRGTRGNPLAPLKDGAYYCFHGFAHSGYDGNDRQRRHEIDRKYSLNLEVFLNKATASQRSMGYRYLLRQALQDSASAMGDKSLRGAIPRSGDIPQSLRLLGWRNLEQ